MASVNSVHVIGNLGRDPELRATGNGQAVCNFSLACNEKWKDKTTGELKERVEWVRIVVWGQQAEACGKYLAKGRQAYVEGRLQTRKWQKDGVDVYTTEVVARSVVFLGGGKGESTGRPDEPPPADDEQIPF